MKRKEYALVNNRLRFRCPKCGVSHSYAVPPGTRRKSIRCHHCAASFPCLLNRRNGVREAQSGKVSVLSSDREVEVFLYDLSMHGVGFLLPSGGARANHLTVGAKVRFKCNWNSRLLGSGFFEIRNIAGQRVGAQKCR
jgi:hypothetical protein